MKRLGLLMLAAVFLMGQSRLPLPPSPYDPLEQLQREREQRQELLERQLEELKRHDPYYSN